MDNPSDSTDSNPQNESVQDESSKPQDPNEQVNNTQDPDEQVQESNKPQDPQEQAEDSNTQELIEQVQESERFQDGNEQGEGSKLQELNEQIKDNEPQDLKGWAGEQLEIPHQQQPEEETVLSSVSDAQDVPMRERLYSSPAPEPRPEDSTLHEQAEDSKPQDLKEPMEESMETHMETPKQQPQKVLFPSTTAVSTTKPIKNQKNEACSTQVPENYPHTSRDFFSTKPVITRNLPVYGKGPFPPNRKLQTAEKAIQCNKMLMRRLPLLVRTPPRRIFIPKVKPPADNKATQRLLKRPPPLVKNRKKKEDKVVAQTTPSKTSPPKLRKRSGSHCGSTAAQTSLTLKKDKKPNVVYNLYITVCDGWKGIDSVHMKRTAWEDCTCSGLSRACTVFSSLKAGRIHLSKLLPVLRTLGILVTSDEMHYALQFVNVDASGTLNFSEFLKVLDKTSPFAETEALQNTLQAFRKIKKGTVTADELKPVLSNLGVNLSYGNIQHTLGHMQISRNGKLDLLEFLLVASKLQRSLEEEAFQNEYTTMGRRPFQDVAELVNAESRWRRKYQSCLNEEIFGSTSLLALQACQCSNENIALAQPKRSVSWKSEQGSHSIASPTHDEEGEHKSHDFIEPKKSYSGITDQRSPSVAPPVHTAEEEGFIRHHYECGRSKTFDSRRMESPLHFGSKSQDPHEKAEEESNFQDSNEQGEDDDKSQDPHEQAEEGSNFQDPNDQGKDDDKSQEPTEQEEDDDTSEDPNEQGEDDDKSQDPTEQGEDDDTSEDLNEQSEDRIEIILEMPEQQSQEREKHSLTHISSSWGKSTTDWKDDLSGLLAAERDPSTHFSALSLDNKIQETAWMESDLEIPELQTKYEEQLPCTLWEKARTEWKEDVFPCCVAERKQSFHNCCCYSATEQMIKHSPVHLAKAPFRRGIIWKPQAPKFKRSEISERMLKQRLPAGIKRKREHKGLSKNQADGTTSSGSPKGSSRRSKVLYNLYTTFYDEGEQFDPCLVQGGKGLSRACTILNAVKKGKININNLLLTLHTLGILVTGAEMHQTLKFVPMDAHGNLEFGDFLGVIKNTLPCTETDALQNAQEVFRKIKKDMVAIEELEPILACLGVTLNPKIIQQALECTPISWDGKVNILTFLLTVREASSICMELDDYATSQDFAVVGDLETQLGRKWSLLEKETQPGHADLITFYDPDEGVTLAQLQRGKNKTQRSVGLRRPSTASSVCHTEQKSKDHPGIQWPKVRPHFGYTSQYTLFPLSSSLPIKEEDKSFVQQPKTKELSPSVNQEPAPSSVSQLRISYEALLQQKKKKMLTFQEKLPKRYDHEDDKNHVSNSRTSESEDKQHSEDLSAQQALQDALDLMKMLSGEKIRDKDLCSTLNKLGVNLNDKEFQEVLQKAVVAKDGMVNINNFMSAIGKTHLFTEFTMLKGAIQAIDKIEGDKMVVHDLPSFMRDMGIHLSDQEFQRALKQVSIDGNGKIVVKDFIKVLTNTSHFSELSVLKDTIKAVSNIQGNKVYLQDLKPTLKNMGIHLYPHEYEELIQTIPTDKNGKIDIEQVTKKISKMKRFSEMEVLNNAIKAFSQFKDKKLKVLDMEVCLNNIGIHLTKSELMEATKSLPVSSDGTVDPKEMILAMKETRRFKNYSAVLDAILALKYIEEHKKPSSPKRNLNSFSLQMANQVIAQVLKSVCMTETGQTKFNEFLRTLTRNQQFRTSAALIDGFGILAKLENGRIGVEELQVIMKSFNFNLPSDEISEVLTFCNIDDDNTVNLNDFIRGVTHTSTFITNPEMQLTCMTLNKLKGDHFDLRALGCTLNAMDLPEASELLQEVMKTAKVDSSGKVNFREFMRILTLVPQLPEGIVLDTFNAMSNIKDRHIHVDDLAGTLASVGINLTPGELQALHSSVTVAGDGTVDFKDIIMSITGSQTFTEFNALHSAFNAVSNICKENITKEDLPAALEDLGIQLSPDELQAALASASIDESGKLDGMEFLKILSSAPHFSELIALQDAMKVVENIKTEKMTVTQLEETLDNMGVHLPDTTFKKTVKSAKIDENGKIGFKDFLLALGETEDFTELEALQRAITVIDTMHGRRLHMNELHATLSNMGIHLKQEEFQQVVHAIDVDADGTVNMKDFLTTLSKMQRFTDSIAFHSAVEAFSKIRDEKVDIRELESVLEYLGIMFNTAEVQKALETITVDENGKVHFKEFLVNLMSSEHFSEPAAVHDIYSFVDLVDDDKVQVSQLKDVLAAFGITLTKEEMKEALKNMTVDSDGKVNLKEFMKGLPNTQRFSTAVELEGAMETINRIKQNKVKIEELDSIMNTMGLHLFPDEITQALKYVTKDADGTINIQDFLFSLTKTRRFSQAELNRVPIKNLDAILENMGINLTEEEMQAVLKQVTVDVEGKVNLNEIMKSLRSIRQLPLPEDTQGDMVAVEDVDSLLSNMGIHLTKEQLQEALKHVTMDEISSLSQWLSPETVYSNLFQPGAVQIYWTPLSPANNSPARWWYWVFCFAVLLDGPLFPSCLPEDGKINFNDFMTGVRTMQLIGAEGKMIEIDDLCSTLAGMGIHLTEEDMEEALKHITLDGNGRVNLKDILENVMLQKQCFKLEPAGERVDIQDLDNILARAGIHLTEEELQEVLKNNPVDAEGKVNLGEFMKRVRTVQLHPQIEERIAVQDLESILASKGIYLNDKELQEALMHVEVNADGTVNLSEFAKAVQEIQGLLPAVSGTMGLDDLKGTRAVGKNPQVIVNGWTKEKRIDIDSLDAVLDEMGIHLTSKQLYEALKYAPMDADGMVDLESFKKGVNTVLTNQQTGQYPDKMSKMLKFPKVLEKHHPQTPSRFFSSISPSEKVRFKTVKNLSKPQLEAFRTAYDTFSKDLDGNIDLSALETTAHNLGISLTEEEALDELVYADTDGDGKVNFTDFLNIITDNQRFIQAVAPNQGDMETVDAQGILFFELLSKLVETSRLPRKTTANIVSYYRQMFLESTGKRAWHSDSISAESKGRRRRGKPHKQKAKSTSISAFAGAARICIMNDRELEEYVEQLQATLAPSDSPYAQVPIFPLIPNRDGMMKGKPKKDLHKLEMQKRMEHISSFEDHFFNKKRWLKQEPKSLKNPKTALTVTSDLKRGHRRLTIDNLEEIRREVKKATDAYRKSIALRERNKSLKLWRRVRGGEIGLEAGNASFYQTFSTYSWSWNVCQELLTPRELQEYDKKFYRNSRRSSTPADKQIRADRRQKECKN